MLNLSKKVEQLLKSELKNSRFFSINNLIESAKRIRSDNAETISENQLIELIMKSQSDSDVNIHLYHKNEIKNGRKMGHLTYIKDKKIL